MGENKHIQELDAFAKKYVKEIKVEQPSLDFTVSIMKTIIKESKTKVFKATPLISKKGWAAILVSVVGILFIPFKESEKGVDYLSKIDFSFFNNIEIPNLFNSISISNTVLYSILMFGLMVLVQVFYLKKYFESRLN